MAGSSVETANHILTQKNNDLKEIENQTQSKLKYIFVNDFPKNSKINFAPT